MWAVVSTRGSTTCTYLWESCTYNSANKFTNFIVQERFQCCGNGIDDLMQQAERLILASRVPRLA